MSRTIPVDSLAGVDTPLLFTCLVGLVAMERLFELALSRRNAQRAVAEGGREFGRGHYPTMVALHSSFLLAAPLEVWLLRRPFLPWLATTALVCLLFSMALRYWVIHTLKDRWTTRIFCRPGDEAIDRGPFRLLRHPNYLAVRLEILALPLVHCAYLTALVYSVANHLLLQKRIAAEEHALIELTDWRLRFGSTAGDPE